MKSAAHLHSNPSNDGLSRPAARSGAIPSKASAAVGQLKVSAPTQRKVMQRVNYDELLHPVGPRLAAKHVYHDQQVYKLQLPVEDGEGDEANLKKHRHNARQVGKIAGRRPEDARQTPNTIVNVTVGDLGDHLKADHAGTAVVDGTQIDTRNYKFASGVAHETIMAFGGVKEGTVKIQVHGDNANANFDHLQSTAPATSLNPNALGAQGGGWLAKKADFQDEANWARVIRSRDRGIADGEAAAARAQAQASA